MKLNTKVLTLMAALAAGIAGAQTAAPDRTGNLTNAGVTIDNIATATFTDPTSTTGGTASAESNKVTTTVGERMGFDVTYVSGADSDTTDNTAGAQLTKTGIVSGTTVAFEYVVVNNGNAAQTITLSTDNTGGVTNVKYYLANPDTNNDGKVDGSDTAVPTVTSVTVLPSGDNPATPEVENNTGMVSVWMSYTVEGNPGAIVGATPIGTGQVWDGTQNTTVTEQKDPAAPAYDDLFWQYSSVTIFTPSVDTTPKDPATGTIDTPPTGGTNEPGYTSPSGTAVAVNGDQQVAYPKADTNTDPDTVVFTNTVTNTTTNPDPVTLTIVPNTSALPGSPLPADYSQTVTPTGNPGEYTVVQTNPDGTTTTATVTISTPSVTVPKNGSTDYTVTVVYPDQDSANPNPIYVAVGVDSGLDNNTTPDAYTFDTIMPPAMQFGDPATGIAADPVPAVNQIGTAGNSVSFPMEIANPGEYADTYTLSGYTVVTLTDGTKQIVPVVYSGTGLTATPTTIAVDLNGDGDTTDPGETVSGNTYTTPSVAANTEIAITATVTLPSNVAATNGDNYELIQTATATYSGISLQDNNDNITVSAVGDLVVAKFTKDSAATPAGLNTMAVGDTKTCTTGAPTATQIGNPAGYTCNSTSYLPGTAYSYQIIAKNNYNTAVSGLSLTDDLTGKPFNTVALSDIVCSDGGTASLDGSIAKCTYPNPVPAGAQVSMTINVTIK